MSEAAGLRRNLILGFCANEAFETIEPFIASFVFHGIDAELCLFAAGMEARFYREVERLGVTVRDAAPFLKPGLHKLNARFLMFQDYLNEHGGRYKDVFLTTGRDVLFQGDPFSVPRDAEVYFACEDGPIRPDPDNAGWIKEIYGEALFDEIADNPISCAANTIGTTIGIRAYVDYVCFALETGKFDKTVHYDQAIHNFIVWKVRPDFGKIDLEDRIVNTIGLTNANRITVHNERIYVDGSVPPVIHQWDRNVRIVALVAAAEKFKLPTAPVEQASGVDRPAEHWAPAPRRKPEVPAAKDDDAKAFFGMVHNPHANAQTLLAAYLDYHGSLHWGLMGIVYETLKRLIISAAGQGFSALQRHQVIGADSRIRQEILDEFLPSRAGAYFMEGNPKALTPTRIFDATPNQYRSDVLPPKYNQRLRLPERPGFQILSAQGRNLYVGPYGYQYFDKHAGTFWPRGSSRTFSRAIADYPECSARRPIVVVQDQFDTGNFAHFLYDSVPRIIYFIQAFPEQANAATFILGGKKTEFHDVILASIAKSYGLDSFNFFFPRERMIFEISGDVHFFSDQSQTIMHPLHMCAPATMNLVRRLLQSIAVPRETPRKLYVSRQDAYLRRIGNEEALIQRLAKSGYVDVTLANLSALDQIGLLVNAKHIISPHGMGLTNIAFNEAGESLTELFSPEIGSDAYAFVATALGLRYGFQVGTQVPETRTGEYEVDIDAMIAQV